MRQNFVNLAAALAFPGTSGETFEGWRCVTSGAVTEQVDRPGRAEGIRGVVAGANRKPNEGAARLG
jgi:hypothetical protein